MLLVKPIYVRAERGSPATSSVGRRCPAPEITQPEPSFDRLVDVDVAEGGSPATPWRFAVAQLRR